MTRLHRDDFRLGQPTPTQAALDHICPICEGDGAPAAECYCGGSGVITAEQAASIAAGDPDPRWQPRPIPPPPPFTGTPCSDCAFRPGSPERDRGRGTGAFLFEALAGGEDGATFYCHQGMHHGHQGYVPRQTDARGAPIGHPICAGWLAQYRRTIR